jgi:transposase
VLVSTRSPAKVVRLPTRPGVTAAAVVLAAIREIIAVEPAWGVRKVWQALRRRGLRVSRKRVWALMHAEGLGWRRSGSRVGRRRADTS